MDFGQLLRDYGAHIIGFVALIQVWLIALYKQLFSRGKLAVYETASIEIGFSGFGPTVTLLGTLRASDKDVFIRRMKVRVVRGTDKAEHTFSWRAFRPNNITLGATEPQSLEIAGSFLVSTAAPRLYNVFFASEAFASQYEAHVQPIRDGWYAFVQTKLREMDEALVGHVGSVLENPGLSATLFNEFTDGGNATALHTDVSNEFFWHAGDYELAFEIETDRTGETIRKKWTFSISPKEEQDLRLNIVILVRELCYLPVTYYVAYKKYTAS